MALLSPGPYSPVDLAAGVEAERQRQQSYQQQTAAGQPLYGPRFRVNPQGAPLFGPTSDSIQAAQLFYENPISAVTQKLAEMGLTTHQTNPFVQYAASVAKGVQALYDLMNPATQTGSESQMAGFTAFAQQVPQLLLGNASGLAGTQFSRKAVAQALRNFTPGNDLGAQEEYGIVADILQYVGGMWMTPLWRKIALQDLSQKWDDFIRFQAANPGQQYSFIQYLVDSGFVSRYFGG